MGQPRVVASIEARLGSSRLPGKVLADVAGRPAIGRLVERLRCCETLDDLVLATTTAPADDRLAHWARAHDVPCYRGSEEDVLQRVVEAHQMMQSDVIVEVNGDCTLLDPEIIDMGVTTFLENDCDVVANVRKPSFPQGIDVQVFRVSDLRAVAETVSDPAVREHVSLYFYEHPERYRILHLFAPRRWHAPQYRFQLDYPEDLAFLNEIYRRLEPTHGNAFGVEAVMRLLEREPELFALNCHCEEKAVR
jgi:spore coat polysaccharide biosynthesis protein SpsF